jgi:energy-coupling factor transporter ATP-binding protein EcfA2
MKIVALSIKNFAGISEADIQPGKITVFSGKNAAGKTSVLNAVRAALEGAAPGTIRKGADRAEILVDLEEIRVRRLIRPSGSTLEVLNAEGFKRPAPQTYLSSILGTTQFNPMEFYRAKAADRTQMLLSAIGKQVSYEEIIEITGEIIPGIPKAGPALVMYELVRKHYYTLRHGKNKALVHQRELTKEARAKVPQGYEPVDIDGQAAGLQQRQENNRNAIARLQAEKDASEKAAKTRKEIEERVAVGQKFVAEARSHLDAVTPPDIEPLRQAVAELERQLEEARKILRQAEEVLSERADLESQISFNERDIEADLKTLASLPGAFDESLLEAAHLEQANLSGEFLAIEKEKASRKLLEEALKAEAAEEALQAEADALDAMVVKFWDELPAQALREANLPIEGLQVDGDNITVNGISIDNLSGAEKMKLALDIARALAADKPLKWIGIDSIEQLDDESFAEFKAQAENDGYQYFATRVGAPREGELEVAGGKVVA